MEIKAIDYQACEDQLHYMDDALRSCIFSDIRLILHRLIPQISKLQNYHISESAVTSLLQSYVDITQELLLSYAYNHKNGNISALKTIRKDFDNVFPVMLAKIREHFISNTTNLLLRLESHLQQLIPIFSMNEELTQGMINIFNIQSSGSDRHDGGQQVMILSMGFSAKQQIKIVYKPFPSLTQALICGDLKTLRQLDISIYGKYHEYESIVEIINMDLKAEEQLPSYIVYPCQDHSGEYGFCEYVAYYPSPSKDDSMKLIKNELTKEKRKDGSSKNTTLDLITNQLKDTDLSEATYILHHPCLSEEQAYSANVGATLCFAAMLGIDDLHCENIIVHGTKLFIIDPEVCLVPTQMLPEVNLCVNDRSGALMFDAKSPHTGYYIEDNKIIPYSIELPAKNQLYVLDGGNFRHCRLDKAFFEAGYQRTLTQFCKKNIQLAKWAAQPSTTCMKLRLLPFSTKTLREELRCIIDNQLNTDAALREFLIEPLHRKCAADNVIQMPKNFPLFKELIVNVHFAITDRLLADFSVLSIPAFYIEPFSRTLFYRGEPIDISEEMKDNEVISVNQLRVFVDFVNAVANRQADCLYQELERSAMKAFSLITDVGPAALRVLDQGTIDHDVIRLNDIERDNPGGCCNN